MATYRAVGITTPDTDYNRILGHVWGTKTVEKENSVMATVETTTFDTSKQILKMSRIKEGGRGRPLPVTNAGSAGVTAIRFRCCKTGFVLYRVL